MRQAGREEFYYTDLNYITFCQISAPQTHLTWYPYIYWLCFSLLSVIAEKFKSVFFFFGQICWSDLFHLVIHLENPPKAGTFLQELFLTCVSFYFQHCSRLGDSAHQRKRAVHTQVEGRKKYCIYNTPHSYIPKSSVCASLCVSASTEIQSLQSTSDLICRARPTHWDDSLEPAPTNSDWQRRNLGCLPRQ